LTLVEAKASGELVLCFALRHLGSEREILVLKVAPERKCVPEQKYFLACPPYAKEPFGNLDCHMTWHASGERHAVSRLVVGVGGKRMKGLKGKAK